ncbi:MAG TPA: hypothetical protein ENJ79_05355 [Gammaproteobacteria bacterium]|nr:hypothetical protein [Gammaproteobacteria bacterium]
MSMSIRSLLLAGLLSLLASCGGGSGGTTTAGIGGTGKIASGTITGFGSIFVNGVRYDIDNADITVDEDNINKSQADLHIGMVVTVVGTANATSGTATTVTYDSVVEGPVTGLTPSVDGLSQTFSVLGVSARIDQATVFDNNDPEFTFSSIADNDLVKLSGFFDTSNTLVVTYIRKTGVFDPFSPSGEAEIKGTVSNAPPGGAQPANGDTFDIGAITVTLTAGAQLDAALGGAVNDGDFVEVKGTLTSATSMDAILVEPEDPALGSDGDEVELEGIITNFSNSGGTIGFQIGNQPIDASNASLEPSGLTLSNDLRVEVEGSIDASGVLVAEKIEAAGNDSIEIDARVSAVDPTGMTIDFSVISGQPDVRVRANVETTFEDRTGGASQMNIGDVLVGDFLQVRGYLDPAGDLVAVEIRREAGGNLSLKGPVQAFATTSSITLLGVEFPTNSATTFTDINEDAVTAFDFYNALQIGDIVEMTDSDGDMIAEEVALEG